jgi:tetratricopeptide (TPR) repeat protein
MSENFSTLKIQGDENMKQEKYEDAIENYTDALDMKEKEDEYKVYLNRCLAYVKLEKYQDALEDATQACMLKQDNAKAWGRVGSCLFALGKEEEAKTAFDRAFQLDPSNEEYKKLAGKEETTDITLLENQSNSLEDTFINKFKKLQSLGKSGTSFIENLPLDGMMSGMFQKMMKNEKLIKLASDNDFHNKIKKYKDNPFEAMKNPVFLDLMTDFMKEINK